MGNVFAYRHIPGDILIYFRDKIKITSTRPKFSFQQMNGRSCIDCCSNILKLGNYIIFFILSLNISESIISKVKKIVAFFLTSPRETFGIYICNSRCLRCWLRTTLYHHGERAI